MNTGKANPSRTGDLIWSKTPKANAELFALTYGCLVAQILRDFEHTDAVNAQLEQLGYNIGVRLIDEYLAKVGQVTNQLGCGNLKEVVESVAKIGKSYGRATRGDCQYGKREPRRTLLSCDVRCCAPPRVLTHASPPSSRLALHSPPPPFQVSRCSSA